MMLDHTHNLVLFRQLDELKVVSKELDSWFCNENVKPAFNGVFCDGIVGGYKYEMAVNW